MADDKALENEIAQAVERDVGSFKPLGQATDRIIRNLRPIGAEITEPADQHQRWMELGEKLHDQQAELVKQLMAKYETKHAELVGLNREVGKLGAQIAEETARLRSIRHRLGYGR